MKYSILFGAIVAATASTAAFAEEMESPLTPIKSNTYNSASQNTLNQNIDLNSVWFNPALAAQNGEQASINLINNTAASIFFENDNQTFGIHLGRRTFNEQYNVLYDPETSTSDGLNEFGENDSDVNVYSNTTGNQSYDVFWAKQNPDATSMGVHTYWSTSSDRDTSSDDVFGNTIQSNNFEIIEDEDNSFSAEIDKNKNSTFLYDFGVNFGMKSADSQLTVNFNTHDSVGSVNHFKASYTDKVAAVSTSYSDDFLLKLTDKQTSISANYVQVRSEALSFIGNAGVSLGNYKETETDTTVVETTTTKTTTNQSTVSTSKYNDISLAGTVDYTITPNERVKFNIQQTIATNLDLNKAEIDNEVNNIDVNGVVTQGTTGVSATGTSNGYSISAPVSLSMAMQATKKLNFSASLNANALYLESRKSEATVSTEVEDDKHVEGITVILDDSVTSDTNTFSTITWGGSYQFNDEFVIDFVSSNAFLTNGVTFGGVTSQLSLTYQF